MSLSELRKSPHWSASSLNQLLNICSLQWAFRRVYRMPAAHTPQALVFGRAFHRAAGAMAEEAPANFAAILSAEFAAAEPPVADPEIAPTIVLGEKMLATLREHWDAPTVRGLSVPFRVPFVDKPLIGEFDAVLEVEGRPVILDWKTSAARWPASKPDRDLQATVYAYAYWMLYGEIPQLRFDIVTKTQTPRFQRLFTSRGVDDFERLHRLGRIAEGITSRQLFAPAEQSFACKGCGYAGPCSNWHLLAA